MKRLLAVLLLAATPMAFGASNLATAAAGLTARAAIDFAIQVPRVMQMKLVGHPAALMVTAEDIAHGRITVSGASIELLVNDRLGYSVRAELMSAAFTAVRVIGLPLGIRMPSMAGRPKPAPVPVEYELQLAADAQPGSYAWPVALSLQDP
jgi:hypothetical protein